MGVRRRSAVVVAPLLVAALCAGSACSSKSDSSKAFCKAMSDSPELYAQLKTNGSLDIAAFKAGVRNIERLAPSEVRPQIVYVRKVYDAYFEVGAKRMTLAEFRKRFPTDTIQTKRAQIDEWMRKHCGFGLES